MKNGFTIMEILVVITIVAIIGVIMVMIFTNTLRGNTKSQALSALKQSGQAILENMDKTVRGADGVCVSPSKITLVLVTTVPSTTDPSAKEREYTRFRLTPPNNTDSVLGNCGNLSGNANGCVQQDFPALSADDDVNAFMNQICTDVDLLKDPQVITNADSQTGISVQPGSKFELSTQTGSEKVVTLKFLLAPAVGAPEIIKSQIDPVVFETTIQLRNN